MARNCRRFKHIFRLRLWYSIHSKQNKTKQRLVIHLECHSLGQNQIKGMQFIFFHKILVSKSFSHPWKHVHVAQTMYMYGHKDVKIYFWT